uniref:Tyrosinase_Cu-bd domain-containing protein n=1 Tax=Heterorhabditis bacteriophora TaxID=37862 RepID=A0A1I7XGX9_HETBA
MKDCVVWIILLITLTIVMGFISETTYVEASEKDSSAFGKHFIPENDIFMSPDWTAEEAKFLKCMNRECSTLNWMKQMGIYNRLSRVHKYSGVHSGPAFTIWHREFLKRLGRPHIFRQFHSDPSGELLNNARVDWLINNPDLNVILGTTMPLTTCPINVTLDARILEYSHDYVHFFISGDMGKSFSSSNDVIFIYHHSMIDLIFETWRQNQQTRIQRELEYPPSNKNCFPPWHFIDSPMPMLQPFKNRDALSNAYTDEIYEFAPRPTCSRENRDCDGSKYLFCVVPPKADAFCMSKVKLGGNCTGFEGTQICYEGYCSRGICQHGTSTEKESILHKHKLNM